MTQLIVDGFGVYGFGTGGASGTGVAAALLAGAYAEVGGKVTGNFNGGVELIEGLPWDDTDTSYWLRGRGADTAGRVYCLRRVLATPKSVIIIAFRVALSQLPPESTSTALFDIRDADNNIMGTMFVSTTGALIWNFGNGTVTTSGPVLVAEAAHHIEMKINKTTGAIECYVDEVVVLNTTVDFADDDDIAQYTIGSAGTVTTINDRNYVLITDFILRDTSGTYNNDIVGDRRVATLLVDSDDPDHQGWTPQPLQRFNVGILDLSDGDAGVLTAASLTGTNLGSGDFTIEGNFRFDELPEGSERWTLFSKWREDNDTRSYRLYKGGPDLNNGRLCFETSTDGTSSTVDLKVQWPWQPDVGVYYHVALCRDSGDLRLFIDGIEQGLPIADADTYYAGSARTAIGAQQDGIGAIVNPFDGWMDEVRLTVGLSRYTANFTPPTEEFPRGLDDPDWANVALLCGFDTGIFDDGPNALTLTAVGGAVAITPGDGDAAYETLNKHTPSDITFIEAALLPAMGTFTLTDVPTATETVTLGSDTYTFVAALTTAYDVLIGGDIEETIENLIAAINAAAGEGTVYGTGTLANADATAELLPSSQMLAVASTPGVAGNSIASTETCADGSWSAATLTGGADIPGYSGFGLEPLPRGVTVVDSITIISRQWKTGAGAATTQTAFEGPAGAADQGTDRPVSTIPTFYFDTFEEDPDTSGVLTPNTINNGRVRINRTT